MWNRLALTGLLVANAMLAAGFMNAVVVKPVPALQPVLAPALIVNQPPEALANSKPADLVVEPGKVHWHATAAAAFAAARTSHKPVLVFHMMGQLDYQFC